MFTVNCGCGMFVVAHVGAVDAYYCCLLRSLLFDAFVLLVFVVGVGVVAYCVCC